MKRLISFVVSLILAVTIIVPVMSDESYAASDIRTSMPSYNSTAGKTYYYSDNNLFYKYNLGPDRQYNSNYGGYCIGNCTWYAYARASEMLGEILNPAFRWSASRWWTTNKEGNYYPYGSKPKVGAIACYSTHVAIVEKVVNGKPYVSESGWRVSKNRPKSASDLVFNYGKPWRSDLKGYIYVLDSQQTKNVNYSIKVSVKDLNMRTGPGTGYSRVGYIKRGTYDVVKERGNWVKLESNGYWVCSDYVTKIEKNEDDILDKGASANYKVKISVSNLNMRTGPGTKYKTVGYIKPGTYKIIKTNNGWGKVKETGYWVALRYTSKVTDSQSDGSSDNNSTGELYTVKINTAALHMRTGPGTSYSSKGLVVYGTKHSIKDTKNGWGQLKKNNHWIKLSYTLPVNSEYNVKVKFDDLNMRTGPGTFYKSKGYLKPGTYTIIETKNGWGKIKSNGYWIKLSYTTKI